MTDPISPDPSRRFRSEWLALCVAILIVGALVVWMLVRDHQAIEAQEGNRLQDQARVIDENLIRQLEGAYKALGGIRAELARAEPGSDWAALGSKLKLVTDSMPGVSSMLLLDVNGTIVASTRDELLGQNFKQRDYFEAPRRGLDPAALYVSPPFKSAMNNHVVVVSRVLTAPGGEFAGVVTATLDRGYFNVVLGSVLYADDMRTALIHGDGKVFLTMPAAGDADETPPVDLTKADSVFASYKRHGQTTALTSGRVTEDDDFRLIALRSIRLDALHLNKPLVVAVSRELDAVFRPWRERALQLGSTFALIALIAAIALQKNQRRRRAFAAIEAAVARERAAGAQRVELALRGADLGLWDLHVPSDTFVINERERALLGFGPDDALPQGAAWRELIHPADRALVEAAIRPHLRGETPSYGCEHRMRCVDGRYVWLSARAVIVERDARGAPIRIVGTHLDITERRAAEARLADASALLRDSEEQLRQVTDNLPALVSRIDLEQRFRFANRAYVDWLHIEPASLLGRSLREVYGEERYAGFRTHVEAALRGERVVYEREMATFHGPRRVEVTLVPQTSASGAVQGAYALIHDITARHEAEATRARSEERLSLALEGSSLALFDWDVASGMMFHSAQAAALRGAPARPITAPATEFQADVHPDDLPAMLAAIAAALKGETPPYIAEFRLRKVTGGWLWVRSRGRVVERDAQGRAVRLAGTYADIDAGKLAEGRLRRLAEFDSLTNLPNRALFHDRLQHAMVRASRGKPMALLFLDIDKFKQINDTLGHDAGDQLLKVFAARMQGAVRRSDTVARLAGDEFTIILEELTELEDARRVADKLTAALRAPIELAGQPIEVTASIGIAMCLPGETDDVALLRRADVALYEAKRRGRDGYFFDDSARVPLAGDSAAGRLDERASSPSPSPSHAASTLAGVD